MLAVADRTAPTPAASAHSDLTLLGLVGLHDPPRRDVEEAIAACQGAGIRVVMVTGDHAVTAASIARSVSLGSEPRVIEGRALADGGKLSAADIRSADVLARVSPGQKLDLVSAYQDAGEVVAMTGDGVNDAPALQQGRHRRRHGPARHRGRAPGRRHGAARRFLRHHRRGHPRRAGDLRQHPPLRPSICSPAT